jgi:hypothetical protein
MRRLLLEFLPLARGALDLHKMDFHVECDACCLSLYLWPEVVACLAVSVLESSVS